MGTRTKTRNLIPVLIVMVGLLFFFHLAIGSYQAVHGPTTTLKETTLAFVLQALIALIAGMILALRRGLDVVTGCVYLVAWPVPIQSCEGSSPLRC